MRTPVGTYFDRIHGEFDAIYTREKSLRRRMVDGMFRRSVEARFRHTLKRQGERGFQRILDVGCGSGRYAVALAGLGAREVTGIDLAPAMIQDAKSLAAKAGTDGQCRFVEGEFLDHRFQGRFDLSLAMGVFDYTPDPVPILSRMAALSDTVITSWPVRAHPLTPVRKLRLRLKGVRTRFYSRNEIQAAFEAAGFGRPNIVRLFRDYVAEATHAPGKAPARKGKASARA